MCLYFPLTNVPSSSAVAIAICCVALKYFCVSTLSYIPVSLVKHVLILFHPPLLPPNGLDNQVGWALFNNAGLADAVHVCYFC